MPDLYEDLALALATSHSGDAPPNDLILELARAKSRRAAGWTSALPPWVPNAIGSPEPFDQVLPDPNAGRVKVSYPDGRVVYESPQLHAGLDTSSDMASGQTNPENKPQLPDRGFIVPGVRRPGTDQYDLGVPGIIYHPYEAARQLMTKEGQYRPGAKDREGALLGLDAASFAAAGGLTSRAVAGGIERNSLGVFGGRVAADNLAKAGRPAARQALDMAEAMSAKGASRDEIWTATAQFLEKNDPSLIGVFKGPDGKWRVEIDDSNATFSNAAQSAVEWTGPLDHPDAPPGLTKQSGSNLFVGPLSEGFPFADVAQAYPKASNLPVHVQAGPRGGVHAADGMSVSGPDLPGRRSVALHELQHEIQGQENFFDGKTAFGDILKADPAYQAVARKNSDALEAYLAALPDIDGSLRGIVKDIFFGKKREAQRAIAKDRYDEASRQTYAEASAAYNRAPSELESRLVEARRDMSAKQRRAEPPWGREGAADLLQGHVAGAAQPGKVTPALLRADNETAGKPAAAISELGRQGSKFFFDPASIRSVNAAFDPANKGKSFLLGANKDPEGAAATASANELGRQPPKPPTYNYVVFPGAEDIIEIVGKDGKPLKGKEREAAVKELYARQGMMPQQQEDERQSSQNRKR